MSNAAVALPVALGLVVVTLVGLPFSSPQADAVPDAVARITDAALHRSELMDTLSYLTDEIGPRLTNSPNFRRAATWTRDRFAAWGLQHAHLEAWGPFGRGWSVTRFSAEMIAPEEQPLIAMPKAWSPATGELTGDAVLVDATNAAELVKYRGRLSGRIALVGAVRPIAAHFAPLGTRYSADDLAAFASNRPFPPNNENFAPPPSAADIAERRFEAERLQFLAAEGVALVVQPGRGFDGGTMEVQAAVVPQPPDTPRADREYPWDPGARTVPQVVVAAEHYNRMARMLARGDDVRLAVNLQVRFDDTNLMSSHTLADVPGSDLGDQIVLVGAHLDSWHAGTGATDNAAGVAVVMEAARLFEALKLRPRRTVRFALWGGEETGGGARPYVEAHIARTERGAAGNRPAREGSAGQIVRLPDYAKYTAYFNIDAGTGKIRGVYLAGNAALEPIFRRWLQPFAALGASTLTMNGDWGSDFQWFDRVGVPIVSFIQDEIEYDTRTHHTNMDVLDRVQPDDLRQAAAVMTGFVYQAAMRDEPLPRKPGS